MLNISLEQEIKRYIETMYKNIGEEKALKVINSLDAPQTFKTKLKNQLIVEKYKEKENE